MNAQLDDNKYDRLLLKIIHLNTTSMKGNSELLLVLSLLFKNSWLVNNTVTGVEPEENEQTSISKVEFSAYQKHQTSE